MPTGIYEHKKLKGIPRTEEVKNKIRSKLMGRRHTEETKEKMRQHNYKHPRKYWLGKKRPDLSASIQGENHPYWKGDDVKYSGLHKWINKQLGRPNRCEFCGKTGLTGRKIGWANKDHSYRRNLEDWIRLCTSCHRKYDLASKNV